MTITTPTAQQVTGTTTTLYANLAGVREVDAILANSKWGGALGTSAAVTYSFPSLVTQFDRSNVSELTVHHKDHNHDNNPPDGSNWELLCLYCHDNEHQRYLEQPGTGASRRDAAPSSTHTPFADLASLLKRDD